MAPCLFYKQKHLSFVLAQSAAALLVGSGQFSLFFVVILSKCSNENKSPQVLLIAFLDLQVEIYSCNQKPSATLV